jgi:hypothetical protein
LYNPVKYTDPTGHLSDEQIEEYIDFSHYDEANNLDEFKENYQRMYNLLRALQFGDNLWSVASDRGSLSKIGELGLDENGYLAFVNGSDIVSVYQVMTISTLIGSRGLGKSEYLVYNEGGSWVKYYFDDNFDDAFAEKETFDHIYTKREDWARFGLNTTIAFFACSFGSPFAGFVCSAAYAGFDKMVGDQEIPGQVVGDRTISYVYIDLSSGYLYKHSAIIRDREIISRGFVPLGPSEPPVFGQY